MTPTPEPDTRRGKIVSILRKWRYEFTNLIDALDVAMELHHAAAIRNAEDAVRAEATKRAAKIAETMPTEWDFAEYSKTVTFADIAAAIRDDAPPTEWRDIATAPKDGTEVLLVVEHRSGTPNCCLVGHYMPGGYCIEDHPEIDEGWYFWNGRMFDKASKPTHWQPLPPPPTKGT